MVASGRPSVDDSAGNIRKIVHKPESIKQLKVLEKTNTGALEEPSTSKYAPFTSIASLKKIKIGSGSKTVTSLKRLIRLNIVSANTMLPRTLLSARHSSLACNFFFLSNRNNSYHYIYLSCHRRDVSQEGTMRDPKKCDPGIQFLPRPVRKMDH